MATEGSKLSSIIAINVKMLIAIGVGYFCWRVWPKSSEWWGFQLVLFVLGLGAAGSACEALYKTCKFIARDVEKTRFKTKGRDPHTDHLVDRKTLRKSDML